MGIEDELRALRDKDKAKTAAILGLKAELDRCELDGSEASTEAAIAQARAWMAAFQLPQLDEKTKDSILAAAELAVRERAAALAAGEGVVH